LSFENMHTGERLSAAYWSDGQYVEDELVLIHRILRDHRTGEIHTIDCQLLDLLHHLRVSLETDQPFQVISGYRSPATNEMLTRASEGVAHKSLHMLGAAIDLRVPGRSLVQVRDTALRIRGGGVGFYPQSNFVHVDVGRVRSW
jgi:uncharacterized protein YcbK (DUF882 family)